MARRAVLGSAGGIGQAHQEATGVGNPESGVGYLHALSAGSEMERRHAKARVLDASIDVQVRRGRPAPFRIATFGYGEAARGNRTAFEVVAQASGLCSGKTQAGGLCYW